MENYLMNYDTVTGLIKGFYLRSIHINIPFPCVEITSAKHDFYMNGLYKLNYITLQDELIPIDTTPEPPTLESRVSSNEDAISFLMGVL
jgi:hypothetical protein